MGEGGSNSWTRMTQAGDPQVWGSERGTQACPWGPLQMGCIAGRREVGGGGLAPWFSGVMSAPPPRHPIGGQWREHPRAPGSESGGPGEPCALSGKTVTGEGRADRLRVLHRPERHKLGEGHEERGLPGTVHSRTVSPGSRGANRDVGGGRLGSELIQVKEKTKQKSGLREEVRGSVAGREPPAPGLPAAQEPLRVPSPAVAVTPRSRTAAA